MRLRMNGWVICGRCGAPLGEGYRFCGGCGAAVGTCPSCSEPLTPGERFCHSCGYALADHPPGAAAVKTAAGPVAMASEPVAERRVCSVLFCDLVGFTPLSEARDPEAVRELLSEYFRAAKTVISRYGGVVEKFIGDAVMAVWGTPTGTEGEGERAGRGAPRPGGRGRAEPQRQWRATGVLSAVGVSQRVDGLEAPLTGRDAELRTIKDLFHATADRRIPRLVLVSGPAGVGKSRLG